MLKQWGCCRRYQWSAFTAAVMVLVVYNTAGNVWLLRFFDFPQSVSRATSPTLPCLEAPSATNEPLTGLDLSLGSWDASRTFKTFHHAAVGDIYSEVSVARQVCLATQCSIASLQEILKSAAHWGGPISLAVFVAGDEMKLLQAFVTWLYRCKSEIYSRLALHITTPAYKLAEHGPLPGWARNCSAQPLPTEEIQSDTNESKVSHPYPQNMLRNIARKNCHTPYVYMVDVDIVPSKNMAESLEQFLSSTPKCKLCAYVIPTYELDWSVTSFPSNKSELLYLAKKNLAIQFHKKVYKYNQLSSNLATWEASRGFESNETHVSHDVTNYKLFYEPFYVAPDTVPPHDERFLGYGFTRNSQVYEMFLLGYKFKVLSPIFTIHWGIQSVKRPQWRLKQISKNYKRFTIFKKELFAKYGKDPLGFFKKTPELQNIT